VIATQSGVEGTASVEVTDIVNFTMSVPVVAGSDDAEEKPAVRL
jgi:hypothetical protein